MFFLKVTDKYHGVAHVIPNTQILSVTARKDCVEIITGKHVVSYGTANPQALLVAILDKMAQAETPKEHKGCEELVVNVDKIAGGVK